MSTTGEIETDEPTRGRVTRDRMVAAAVQTFGSAGFDVGIRTIARHANAAAALIQYYFGGKDGLRSACDRYVYEIVDEWLPAYFHLHGASLPQPPDRAMYAPVMQYCLRSIAEGGPLAERLVSRMATHVYGLIHPTSDSVSSARTDVRRARQVARLALGVTLLDHAICRPACEEETTMLVAAAWEKEFLPLIERARTQPDFPPSDSLETPAGR